MVDEKIKRGELLMKRLEGVEADKEKYENSTCGNCCGRASSAQKKIDAYKKELDDLEAECIELKDIYTGERPDIEIKSCKTCCQSTHRKIFGHAVKDETDDDKPIKTAYIVFRSMEAKARVEEAFKDFNWIQKTKLWCRDKCCTCCYESIASDYDHMYFQENTLP